MKCPKCNFISFDYLDSCKKCGRDLTEDKAKLGIRSIKKKAPEPVAILDSMEETSGPLVEDTQEIPGDEDELSLDAVEEEAFSLDESSFDEVDSDASLAVDALDLNEEPGVTVEEKPLEPLDFGELSSSETETLDTPGQSDEAGLFLDENLDDLSFNSEFEPTFDGHTSAPEEVPMESGPLDSPLQTESEESLNESAHDESELSFGEEAEQSHVSDSTELAISFGEEFTASDIEENGALASDESIAGQEAVAEDEGLSVESFEIETASESDAGNEITEEKDSQISLKEEDSAGMDTDADLSLSQEVETDEEGFSFDFDETATADKPEPEGGASLEGGQMPLSFEEEESHEDTEKEEPNEVEAIPNIEGVKKGGFFKRLLAYTVDNIIQTIIVYAFLLAGIYALKKGVSVTGEGLSVEHIAGLMGPVALLAIIVNAGYFTFFHWATGQTLGKMLFGLKVVRKDGRSVGLGRSFLRWFCYNLSALPLMLGYLIALVDKQNQTLHDKIAGTYVINIKALANVEESDDVEGEILAEEEEMSELEEPDEPEFDKEDALPARD